MIIISSGVLFLVQLFFPGIIGLLGLVPARVVENRWYWQPVTYLFLHGGFLHWLFNMLVVLMFGRQLEEHWGTPYFLRYFFLCGLGAAACVLLISPHSPIPTIGASGAIFGLLVAYALLAPDAVIYVFLLVPMKMWHAAVLFGLIELFAALQSGGSSPIAHLGGMATGYLLLKSNELGALRRLHPLGGLGTWWHQHRPFRKKSPVEFHEVTDDLVKEVDRILDKILKQGVESLSSKEKDIMERYSKLKH